MGISQISIPTARKGGDDPSGDVCTRSAISIPTARKGGDNFVSALSATYVISIPTARKGGDVVISVTGLFTIPFQSPPPAKAVT